MRKVIITGLLGAMMSNVFENVLTSSDGGDIFLNGDPHTKDEWD